MLLLASTACGSARSVNPFDPSETRPGVDRLRIEVQNLNFNDATVYAMRQSQRIRLGRVTGKSDQVFTIDWSTAVPVRFRIDLVSGPSCGTAEVPVDRNSLVWVTIPSVMGLGGCRAGRR